MRFLDNEELRSETLPETNYTTGEAGGRLAKFRQKPELLVVPFLSFWLIINVPNWPMYNGSIAVLVVRWGTIDIINGSTNSIFPLTYALAVLVFVFFLLRFRKNIQLGWKRSVGYCWVFRRCLSGELQKIIPDYCSRHCRVLGLDRYRLSTNI